MNSVRHATNYSYRRRYWKLGKVVEPDLEGESENVPEKWRVEQPRVGGITSR